MEIGNLSQQIINKSDGIVVLAIVCAFAYPIIMYFIKRGTAQADEYLDLARKYMNTADKSSQAIDGMIKSMAIHDKHAIERHNNLQKELETTRKILVDMYEFHAKKRHIQQKAS